MGDVEQRSLVVVGASAGGVEALQAFAGALPPDLAATVLVVLHVMPTGTSVLPDILERAGPLPVRHARDGDRLEPGEILVAPPNFHLLVEDGVVQLSLGPKENGHRPAVDPLFRTAAQSHGPNVVGVVLSGSLDDGTAGLRAIRIHGGATLVQSPREAAYPSMPESAIMYVGPDYVLPVRALAERVGRIVAGGRPAAAAATGEPTPMTNESPDNVYTCPDCGGALEETNENGLLRFRCKVGHQYSEESFLHLQAEHLEAALWAALRALEDRAELTASVAERMRRREHGARLAARYHRQSDDARRYAQTLRELLEQAEAMAADAAGVAHAG